jgi:hypothetical protein
MGLLDIWSDWKKDNQSQSDGFEDYTSTNGGTLDTAGGMKGSGINATMDRKSESPLVQNPIFTKDNFKKVGNKIYDALPGSDLDRKFAAKEAEKIQGIPKGEMMPVDNEEPSNQIDGNELSKDGSFMSKLAGMAGVDLKQAGANWKEKGGFEGLMSNPAFSLGLALMQSSANGKTINQGILDNFVKSAKISSEFKDRIRARKQEPIQATAGDISETKDLLKQMNIEEGNWFENIISKAKGGKPGLEWDSAVEEISLKYQMQIRDEQERLKEAGKSQVIRKTDKIRIMRKLIKEGKIKESGGIPFLTSSTLSMPIPKAEGGPIQEGKSYLVGEKGPEIIIPSSDGNVLTNDDSQIFNMLLASNPQLQKVSKQRAERILKSRFPEYFEG